MKNNNEFRYLTINEALDKVSKMTTTPPNEYLLRDGVIKEIGETLYNKLCALGYLTQGAAGKTRVCRRTGKRSITERFQSENTPEQNRLGYNITYH